MAHDTMLIANARYRKREDAPPLHPEPPELLTAIHGDPSGNGWIFRDDSGLEWTLSISEFRAAYDADR